MIAVRVSLIYFLCVVVSSWLIKVSSVHDSNHLQCTAGERFIILLFLDQYLIQ